jgi:hypothetical protein
MDTLFDTHTHTHTRASDFFAFAEKPLLRGAGGRNFSLSLVIGMTKSTRIE